MNGFMAVKTLVHKPFERARYDVSVAESCLIFYDCMRGRVKLCIWQPDAGPPMIIHHEAYTFSLVEFEPSRRVETPVGIVMHGLICLSCPQHAAGSSDAGPVNCFCQAIPVECRGRQFVLLSARADAFQLRPHIAAELD